MSRLPMETFGIRQSLPRVALAFVFLLLPFLLAGCPRDDKKPANVSIARSDPTVESKSPVVPAGVAFNGQRAMDHVRWQVEIGPRPPGSPALAKTRQYIVDTLKSYGLKVTTDEFTARTPIGPKNMANITAEIPGESENVIMLGSHYDSKYYKDMHFVGANDPGSSVGTLIELGRVLAASKQKPKFTYWLVFFDGEEAFCETWDECSKPAAPDNTYGSREYVGRLTQDNELKRMRALILLDMVGYKNLDLGRDTLSTRWLQDIIWRTARELGHGKVFVDRPEGIGGDDHVPFLQAGVDAVDIIQLGSYPYWHRPDDTLDKVSPESMKIVGDVVLASLPRVAEYLQGKGRK